MQIAWTLIRNIALWRIVTTVHELFKKILEAKVKDMFAAWCSDRKGAVISTPEKVEESFFENFLHLLIINFIYVNLCMLLFVETIIEWIFEMNMILPIWMNMILW